MGKEGVLPFSSFWRSEYRSPLQTLFRAFSSSSPVSVPYDKTPMPALFLHWATSTILVLCPPAGDLYSVYTRVHSYIFSALFGVFLSGGLLYYGYYKQYQSDRKKGTYQWRKIAGFRPWLGPIFPAIYLVGNLVMVAGFWIPPSNGKETTSSSIAWFVTPTAGLSTFVVAIIYWFVLTHLIPLWSHKTLRVKRTPFFDADENFRYEEVITRWIPGPEEEPEKGDPALQDSP